MHRHFRVPHEGRALLIWVAVAAITVFLAQLAFIAFCYPEIGAGSFYSETDPPSARLILKGDRTRIGILAAAPFLLPLMLFPLLFFV